MDALQSERELFLIFCMTLMVAAPIVSWLVIPSRAERSARLWFLGAALLGMVSVVYFLNRAGTTVLITVNLAAAGLAVEALRGELGRRPFPWSHMGLMLLGIAAGHELLLSAWEAGHIVEGWVLGPRVLMLVVAEWWIVMLALQVSRLHDSRGLLLTAFGTGLLGVINTLRLLLIVMGTTGMGPEIGSRAFPTLAAVLTFTALTYSFGYVAFALEKSWARTARAQEELARAQEREAAQRGHAQELQELIAQRDEMLMQSTRLMTLRTMGLYNAAVVHEISQPLQALRAVLDGMRLDEVSRGQPSQELEQAGEMAAKAAMLVQSLHRLLSHQQSAVRPVSLNECIAAIAPVLQGEARRLEVDFEWAPDPRLDSCTVQIEPLLMQRLLMNLVGNSLDALSRCPPGSRRIRVSTARLDAPEPAGAQLQVQDSGPGFAESVLEGRTPSVVSSKSNGMGLGLNLSRMLVSSWKGTLALGTAAWTETPGTPNRPDSQPAGPGAQVTVRLPLA